MLVRRAGLALIVLVSACGGGSDAAADPAATGPMPKLPACAGSAPPVALPAAMPDDFPFPPGTRVTSARSLSESQLLVGGLIPGELHDAATFFTETLPDRGYQVGVGDAESTEAEAPFTGKGFRGRWRVNEIEGCRALTLTLVLIRQS